VLFNYINNLVINGISIWSLIIFKNKNIPLEMQIEFIKQWPKSEIKQS